MLDLDSMVWCSWLKVQDSGCSLRDAVFQASGFRIQGLLGFRLRIERSIKELECLIPVRA